MARIVEFNEFDQFSMMKETWNNVLNKTKDRTIFLTWEWLSTWWKHFGKRKNLVLLLVEEKDRVIAIACLMYSNYKLLAFKLRKMKFVGTGISDYHDFLLTRKKTKCLKLLMNYLENYPLRWDCLELSGIPETSESLLLLHQMPKNFGLKWKVSDVCPHIPLPSSFDVFIKGLSRNMRYNLRRRKKKLESQYKVDFKKYSDVDSTKEAMYTFFKLHRKRWELKSPSGALVARGVNRDFHLDVAKSFAENGWLNLSFLTINDEPIASLYSFEYGQKLYQYLTAFDPEYSTYGPGNLLISYLIQDCIRNGIREFDFMRGAESYKYAWNAVNRRIIEVSHVRKGLVPSVYSRAKTGALARAGVFFARKLKIV